MVGRCRGLGDAQALPRFLNEAKVVHEGALALPQEIDEINQKVNVALAPRKEMHEMNQKQLQEELASLKAIAEDKLPRDAANDVFSKIDAAEQVVQDRALEERDI